MDGGQNYKAIGIDKQTNAKYLIQEKGSVKVPDYSHSANQIYAVIQNDQVKTIAIYPTMEALLEGTCIDNRPFKDVIMDVTH